MARINKSQLTRLEIIRIALRLFLKNGYTNTSVKAISNELDMSTGNLTFYFPSKEHLLAELINVLCDFQWKMIEEEANEGYSSIMAVCLELMSMAAMCEENVVAKDIYISSYTSPMALEIIRKNDTARAKKVFKEYCPGWTDEQFAEAETLVSGIEYATLMTTSDSAPLDIRIAGALDYILAIYNVPEELRRKKIRRVLDMDYRKTGNKVLKEFIKYAEETNEQAFDELLHEYKK